MALEESIAALTKAVEANTAALAKIGAAAKPAGAATPKPAAPKETTKKVELKDVTGAFGAYLSVSDEDERAKRKSVVAAFNTHFGVDKVSNLPADKFGEALGLLKQYEANEDPLSVFEAASEEESLV